jgi:eukaryotic-like serine/threonine-protein kinase
MRAGARLGRYEIDAEIGRGAMGIVCRARDPKIDRIVAIKTISLFGLDPEEEAEYRERFFTEARAAGRLSHPGIVTIFDVGEETETHSPYIVMEYVTGQSLQTLLSREKKKLPLRTALELAQELAEALDYAHTQGVVHRDIKPANILLTADGKAKIADFGIAKLNQAHMTLPGQVLGSPAFMAPEQLSGEGVDARSDLFSLGVILYTMLTGHRPFQGNSATTVCFKVVHHEPVSVTAFDSDFPPELDQLVSRAMAKNPVERYQTGLDMALAIKKLREDTSTLSTHRNLEGVDSGFNVISLRQKRLRPSPEGAARWLRAPWSIFAPACVLIAGIVFFVTSRTIVPASRPVTEAPPVSVILPAPTSPIVVAAPVVSRRTPSRPAKPLESAKESAKLRIETTHDFAQAEISIWSDSRLVYSQTLQGENKTHALVFRTVQGSESDSVWIPIGKHQLTVRVQSADGHYDHSKTVAATFLASGENILQITSDKKHNLLHVALR